MHKHIQPPFFIQNIFLRAKRLNRKKIRSAEVKFESLKAILPQQAMWETKVCEKLHYRNSPKPTELDCLSAAGPAWPVCPINWSNNWVNTGHEYSSVSLLGKDSKRIASPLAVILAVMQSFQLGRDCLSLEQIGTRCHFYSVILRPRCCCCTCPACAHLRTEGMVLPFIYPKHQHNTRARVSWAHLPSQKPAMAAIFRTVLWLNATGARECTFSTLPNHRIWTALKAAAQGGVSW